MAVLEEFERLRTAPFVKWAGGKGQLLRKLESSRPSNFGVYFEPFLGGGAFFFNLWNKGLIKKATLSDSNRDLINCYLTIRDHLSDLLGQLRELQKHAKDENFYYSARKRFNAIKLGEVGSDIEKGALLLYLNKTCYNGLYRVNRKGAFNVPWGAYKNPRIYDERNLRAVNEALHDPHVTVACRDYKQVESEAKAGDFIYFDPPYQPVSPTANFTGYTQEAFAMKEQRELAGLFHRLARRHCHVMLSNSVMVKDLYKNCGYTVQQVKAARAISSVGAKRGPVDEVLVTSYKLVSR